MSLSNGRLESLKDKHEALAKTEVKVKAKEVKKAKKAKKK